MDRASGADQRTAPQEMTCGRPATAAPTLRSRLIVAVVTAALTAIIASVKFAQVGYPIDFALFWSAGRALVHGLNPYAAVMPGGPFKFDSGFLYPLPAAIAVAPLGFLPVNVAGQVFAAVGMGSLAFVLTRDGWQRWPILMSFPALWAVSSGQWSPFVTVAALTPAFAWAAACKPTLGLAAYLYRPSWRFLAIGGAFTVLAFLFQPSWPADWIHATQTRAAPGSYHVPLLVPGGIFLLLAALRWRRPEARLLLGMACIPQTMFPYDQLALGLVAQTRLQALVFSLWSYLAVWGARFVGEGPIAESKADTLAYLARVITWTIYLPLLVVVLRRPNVGIAAPWLESAIQRVPRWLRGQAA
jgi:hypothetical protein